MFLLKSRSMRAFVFSSTWLLCAAVRADALQDNFNTVWESLWYQGGSPSSVARWNEDIRVSISGKNVTMHEDRIMQALETVAGAAGRKVVRVTAGGQAGALANLDVEIVDDRELDDNQPCFVRYDKVSRGRIEKAVLKMRTRLVYHCVLHESMHAMGIVGHPTGNTVLSYFYQRVDAITDLDRLMLRAWYSPEMRSGMSPFQALVVLTEAVVVADGGATPDAAGRRGRFLDDTLRHMEAFAGEKGEIPIVLKRSGKASADGMQRGQQQMGFYLGLAFANGDISPVNEGKAAQWFGRGASAGFAPSQMAMGFMAEKGMGMEMSAAEAFVWYSLAAAQSMDQAEASAGRMASVLTEEQRRLADARIAAFKR